VPNLTIRDVPDDLYALLKALAERERRSLQQTALVLLGQARRLADAGGSVEEARALRARFGGRRLGDVVSDVRQERAR